MSQEQPARKGLGRGLSALIGDQPEELASGGAGHPFMAPIEMLRPNPHQPRRQFDADELEELAASIREKGVIQPIIARPSPDGDGGYEIVAGERRWRAAQMARLHEAPIVIRELSDADVAEIALIENVQRADLNPIEEAAGYQGLIDHFEHTQETVAKMVGRSRPHVANMLRLLSLPEKVRGHLISGALTAGHGRALIGRDDAEALAKEIVAKGLTVRDAERLTKKEGGGKPRKEAGSAAGSGPGAAKDADTKALEADLKAALGVAVDIRHQGVKGGEIRLGYRSLDELDDICRRLCQSDDDDELVEF